MLLLPTSFRRPHPAPLSIIECTFSVLPELTACLHNVERACFQSREKTDSQPSFAPFSKHADWTTTTNGDVMATRNRNRTRLITTIITLCSLPSQYEESSLFCLRSIPPFFLDPSIRMYRAYPPFSLPLTARRRFSSLFPFAFAADDSSD